jgi:isopenicillin-N N-acyltransferase-like protein
MAVSIPRGDVAPTLPLVATDALDPHARGAEAGAALVSRVELVVESYGSLFRTLKGWDADDVLRFGERVLRRVAGWRPALVDELAGFAQGCGRPVELVAALNARTEVVAGSECSTIARTAGGDAPWVAQNWDWYLDAPGRCVLWSCATEGGRLLTMTEAGLLAKVGINSQGLAVSLNILTHAGDGGPVGVPVHLLLRELLATCATVDDAAALVAEAEMSASSAITVVDAQGGGATFELSPDGPARLDPDADGRLYHTNIFLDEGLARSEANLDFYDGSQARLDAIREARPETLDEARVALCGHASSPQTVCRHGEQRDDGLPPSGTVISLLMEPAAGRLQVADGTPCSTGFVPYELHA